MQEFQEVVFEEDTRVVAGAHLVPFKANVPQRVNPIVVGAALALGGKVRTPTPKAPPRSHQPAQPPQPPPPEDVGLRAVPEVIKTRRKRRKKRTDADIIATTVEYMAGAQPSWKPEQYDLNKLPRMSLFGEAVPDLTPTLREAAWDIFISGQRDA
jgi:hypothetical protein